MNELTGEIRIGKNSSHYSINIKCTLQNSSPTKLCELSHPNFKRRHAVQFLKEGMENHLTVKYFGRVNLDFHGNRINLWDTEFILPTEYSYVGMDEISIENFIVNRVEHSNNCQGMDEYEFDRQSISVGTLPSILLKDENIPVPRRTLNTSTYVIPEYRLDYYDFEGSNSFLYDIRLSQDPSIAGNVAIVFWNKKLKQIILKLTLTSKRIKIEAPNEHGLLVEKLRKLDINTKICRGRSLDFRFKTISKSSSMDFFTTVSGLEKEMNEAKLELLNINFDEIRFFSDNGNFYEVKMNPLEEVVMTTCNYRKIKYIDSSETIPFLDTCYRKRRILCQKRAENAVDKTILNEPKEKSVWKEKIIEIIQTTPETKKIEKKVEKKKERKIKEEVKEVQKEKNQITDFEEFKWTIITLTSLAAAAFSAIIVLNIVRCGL